MTENEPSQVEFLRIDGIPTHTFFSVNKSEKSVKTKLLVLKLVIS